MRNLFRHARKPPVGPNVFGKADRIRLQEKSLKVFGSKHKWRKLAGKLGLDVASIEEQMDAILKAIEVQINASKKVRSEEAPTSTLAAESDDGSGEGT